MSKLGKSYQQKLFDDEELALPQHDQIVRWVDLRARQTPGAILRALNIDFNEMPDGQCYGWGNAFLEPFEPTHGYLAHDVRSEVAKFAWRNAPPRPPAPQITISPPIWEPIIKGERGGIAAALDLKFTVTIRKPALTISTTNIPYDTRDHFQPLLSQKTGFGHSFFYDGNRGFSAGSLSWSPSNLALPPQYKALFAIDGSIFGVGNIEWRSHESDKEDTLVIVEAKTKIRSAGELLRQLNAYRSLIPGKRRILVVAPRSEVGLELEMILQEQGIDFLAFQSN